MNLKWDDVNWILLSQDMGKWWAVVNRAKYLSFHIMGEISLFNEHY
jgi:hypothetical protein